MWHIFSKKTFQVILLEICMKSRKLLTRSYTTLLIRKQSFGLVLKFANNILHSVDHAHLLRGFTCNDHHLSNFFNFKL